MTVAEPKIFRISLPERVFDRLFCRGDVLSVSLLGSVIALFAVNQIATFIFLMAVLATGVRASERREAQSSEKLVPQPQDDLAFGLRTAK